MMVEQDDGGFVSRRLLMRRSRAVGIMSAIDFDFDMERLPDPKGDRVKITMSGKFLPYKYYGNEQGIPALGYKED
jgi:hypothetical protein